MTEKRGTFLVTHAGDDDAVLADVTDGQVHALSGNPGVETGEVLAATLAADPPMEVTWSVADVAARWRVEVECVEEEPSSRARDLAADAAPGELVTANLGAGDRRTAEADPGSGATSDPDDGELHVLSTPDPEAAAADVVADDATRRRAARLGASRVEVRTGDGFVAVRYPD